MTDLGRPRPFFTGASASSSTSVATDLRGRPLAFFADGASTSSTSSTFSSAGSDLRGRPLAFFGATSTSASSSASATGVAFFGRPRPFFGVASSVLAAAVFLPFLAAGFSASSSSSSAASVLAGRPRFLPVGFFALPPSSPSYEVLVSWRTIQQNIESRLTSFASFCFSVRNMPCDFLPFQRLHSTSCKSCQSHVCLVQPQMIRHTPLKSSSST